MLTGREIRTMILIRNQQGSPFNPLGDEYRLPMDIIRNIADTGFEPNPNSDIATLLHLIAYGDLAAARNMLDANPALIGKASHVTTPSGLIVRYVKPYECALGAGDFEMAAMIARYFDHFTDGTKEKAVQDAKYRPHIENMLNEKPYDFQWLINIIKSASPEDVAAEHGLTSQKETTLSIAMETFRVQYAAEHTKAGRMHFRYVDVLEILKLIDKEWGNLGTGGDQVHSGKLGLAMRQIYGYVIRNFPAIDRMLFAQSDYTKLHIKQAINRSFKLRFGGFSYPDLAEDSPRSGLGFEYYIIPGQRADREQLANMCLNQKLVKRFVELKQTELINVMLLQSPGQKEAPKCAIS